MDQSNPSNWRGMFERGGTVQPQTPRGKPTPPPGFDDGYQHPPSASGGRAPLTHADITDEATMALALDAPEYKPWVLQHGSGRPAMMLHLRRFEPKSGLWVGWQLAYPHLVAVEYIGDKMLSLDFGTRQFVIEGTGLQELARHLQSGSVLMVQEYSPHIWQARPLDGLIDTIARLGNTENREV
jgi:hypothetical protein